MAKDTKTVFIPTGFMIFYPKMNQYASKKHLLL